MKDFNDISREQEVNTSKNHILSESLANDFKQQLVYLYENDRVAFYEISHLIDFLQRKSR